VPLPLRRPVGALLCDRDDTLIEDVPYNGDPALVCPRPGVSAALARVRACGLPVGVVSNQSGVGRGALTLRAVHAVHRRVDDLLGPFDVFAFCPHVVCDDCACRKPAPGLIIAAAHSLGVAPSDCVMIGDIGADVEAARRAGALGILVPTGRTLPDEIATAEVVAETFADAVDLVLSMPRTSPAPRRFAGLSAAP
jgi:D-glycero-D-manno-heptose 1,7-bisphosphate phosphatase